MSRKLNIHEAAIYLGRGHQAVRRLVAKGVLGATLEGQAYMFSLDELEKVKAANYPEGLTHGQIARLYGVLRTTVIYQFRRLEVPTVGSQHGYAAVYDQATVEHYARLLEWGQHHDKSQTGES